MAPATVQVWECLPQHSPKQDRNAWIAVGVCTSALCEIEGGVRRLWRWLLETHISSGLVLRTRKCGSMTLVASESSCSNQMPCMPPRKPVGACSLP